MHDARLRWATSCLFLVLCGGLGAQEPAEPSVGLAPRTSDGRPDLEGVWDFRTLTPLERPEALGERTVYTPEEAAEIEARAEARADTLDAPSDPEREARPVGSDVGAYNNFWFDRGARVSEDLRTSLIVDPPDGRVPPLRPGVERQALGDDQPTDLPVRLRVGGIGTDGPESRGLSERCLLGFNEGPPITPGGYNQNIRIVQTRDHVAILNEMNHDVRIVPLDGRPHLGSDMRSWTGDSRGHWEGDTLVVETVNFSDRVSSFSASPFAAVGDAAQMRLTERFRRLDADTLHYEFTVEDPATYTRPITAVLLMARSDDRLYEYACHEGNYAMGNMLRGARLEESRTAAEKAD